MTKAQEEKLDLVAGSILRVEASNSVLQESVNKVLQSHLEIKNDLEKLTNRVLDLEQKFAAAPSAQSIACSDNGLVGVQEKIDDLENRSRWSNVLFYGITDSAKSETWEESERLVNNFCTEKLGLTVASISRAHRVGRFSSEKKRPIIAKFFNEKEVELVLSRGFKLKNTSLSISRNYSETVREKRRKLLQFSRTMKKDGDRAAIQDLKQSLVPIFTASILQTIQNWLTPQLEEIKASTKVPEQRRRKIVHRNPANSESEGTMEQPIAPQIETSMPTQAPTQAPVVIMPPPQQ
ncbi:hypothetical protein HPB49_016127 [Dermacentor silvarum]|uniref:Uncharacterized protein n=1 Tax=Dermacentor silvarum TaxID=543639 RepID=A0ACB8CG52_DERSI|nr:hypothetical protein HPB49_016127 [Dermacentor silvarum]